MNIPGRLEPTAVEAGGDDPEADDYWESGFYPALAWNGHEVWRGTVPVSIESYAIEDAESHAVKVLTKLFTGGDTK